MRMPKLKGLLVPPITPMYEDGSLDIKGVIALTEKYLSSQYVDGLFAIGATGEYTCLSKEDRILLIQALSKANRYEKIIAVNTGGLPTDETLELSRLVKDCHLDALAVTVPTHLEDTQDAVLDYYKQINQVGLPFMVYRPPFIKTHRLSEELISKMMLFENFVALKDSSRDMELFAALCAQFGEQISVFQGVEMLHLPSLACGSAGTVGGGLNIYPKLVADITSFFDKHEIDEAIELQRHVTLLWNSLNPDGSCRWRFKLLWKHLGIIKGTHCRIGNRVTVESNEMSRLAEMLAF